MLCKWCGMESASKDQCSWCNRPFTPTTSEGATESQAPTSSNRPSVSLRRSAPATRPVEDSPVEEESAHEIGAAPKVAAAPQPQSSETASEEPTPHRIIGLKRPVDNPITGGGFAQKPPPPTMPVPLPLRKPLPPVSPKDNNPGQTNLSGTPSSIPPTIKPHMPAPGVPIAHRSGVNPDLTAKRPPAPPLTPTPKLVSANGGASSGTSQAPPHTPQVNSSRPAIPTALLRTTKSGATAVISPEEDSGGLASGMTAPRSGSSTATMPEVHVPQLGTFTASKSKYYQDQVIDPSSGTHYDSATGSPTNVNGASKAGEIQLHWDDEPQIPQSRIVSRFLFVFSCILASVGVFSFAFRPSTYVLMILCLIGSGLLMPIMRAAPWQRDDSDDLVWYLMFTIVFGPFIGLIFYGAMALMRQSVNHAMVGCFLITIMTLLMIFISAGGAATGVLFGPPWLQAGGVDMAKVLINGLAGLLPVVGWFLANFFHKLDE